MSVPHPDDHLGAFCSHVDAQIAGRPGGSLRDCTFAAKDLFAVEGERRCGGNPDWLATHDPLPTTAPAVQRMLDAGASLVGMTRCDELAYSITGRNAHYGMPVNPRAPGRLPGGSSSGSASAVAGGLVDAALGTDTTGSLRTPAALCGLHTLRVTHGSIPMDGVIPLAPSFDSVGVLTAGLERLRDVMAVLLGSGGDRPDWRAAVLPADGWDVADVTVGAVVARTAHLVEDALPVARGVIAREGLEAWARDVGVFQASEIWAAHGEWIEQVDPAFGPGVGQRMAVARSLTREQATTARSAIEEYGRHVLDVVGDDGVLVIPTSPTVAPMGDVSEDDLTDWRRRVMQLTAIANVSGLPQLAIPAGDADGNPVSVSLVGPPGSDLALIDLALGLGLA